MDAARRLPGARCSRCSLPALLAFELALLPVAARGGWLRAKLRAQAAVLRSLPAMLRRRRARPGDAPRSPDAAFAAALTASLDSPYLGGRRAGPGRCAPPQAAYWRAVRAALR